MHIRSLGNKFLNLRVMQFDKLLDTSSTLFFNFFFIKTITPPLHLPWEVNLVAGEKNGLMKEVKMSPGRSFLTMKVSCKVTTSKFSMKSMKSVSLSFL